MLIDVDQRAGELGEYVVLHDLRAAQSDHGPERNEPFHALGDEPGRQEDAEQVGGVSGTPPGRNARGARSPVWCRPAPRRRRATSRSIGSGCRGREGDRHDVTSLGLIRECLHGVGRRPSLDRDRILTLAQLGFIERSEVIHFLGPPGTGKSHLAMALGVEAVKAGKSIYFSTLADLLASLARAEREGRLQERIRFFRRPSLLVVNEIGYLPVIAGGGNLPARQRPLRARCHDPDL